MRLERARELLEAFRGRRVLLLGDLMMDEWVFGAVRRISPEAPIPVVQMPLGDEAREHKPGGAGNVAAILLGLGAAVRVVGVVGDDERGRRLAADLARRGAEVEGVLVDPGRPTTHKLRILAGRQQLLRIDTERAAPLPPDLAREVRERTQAAVAEADVLLVSDYAKGVVSSASFPPEVMAAAREAGVPVCADPKPANIELFRGAALVSPNEAEALEMAGGANAGGEEEAVLSAGRALLERLGAEAVFVTRGERGIAVFLREGGIEQVEAGVETGSVGDGTGCGDAASAVGALALAAGAGFLEAAQLANAAGGVVSRFVGVHSPQAEEILGRLRARQAGGAS